MSRLEKKCFIASAAAHALLIVVLVLAPAFFVPKRKPPAPPLLDVIPSKIVDGVLFGGNQTQPAPPPQPQPAPQPQPQAKREEPRPAPPPPEPRREPEPPPRPPKRNDIPRIEPEPKKTAKPKAEPKKPPQVSLQPKIVSIGKAEPKKNHQKQTENDHERREQEQRLKELARAADTQAKRLNQALNSLRDNLSNSTDVHIPGPGSEAFANYAQVVKSIYDRAWVFREDIADLRATVEATITVARDGTVLSARITRKSGTTVLDRSVQEVLERVKFIAPFPDGATEIQRTFDLTFNPALKRATG